MKSNCIKFAQSSSSKIVADNQKTLRNNHIPLKSSMLIWNYINENKGMIFSLRNKSVSFQDLLSLFQNDININEK